MKNRFPVALLTALCLASGSAFPSVLVKEKAKQLANPNYVPKNPVVAPQPAAPSAATTPATVAEPSFTKLTADIAILKTKSAVPPELRERLLKDLTAVIQSTPQPSPESLSKLVEDFSASVINRKMSPQEQSDMARNLGLALFRAKSAPNELPPLLKGLSDTLVNVDVPPDDAKKIVADLKTVISELQAGPGKAATK